MSSASAFPPEFFSKFDKRCRVSSSEDEVSSKRRRTGERKERSFKTTAADDVLPCTDQCTTACDNCHKWVFVCEAVEPGIMRVPFRVKRKTDKGNSLYPKTSGLRPPVTEHKLVFKVLRVPREGCAESGWPCADDHVKEWKSGNTRLFLHPDRKFDFQRYVDDLTRSNPRYPAIQFDLRGVVDQAADESVPAVESQWARLVRLQEHRRRISGAPPAVSHKEPERLVPQPVRAAPVARPPHAVVSSETPETQPVKVAVGVVQTILLSGKDDPKPARRCIDINKLD